MKHIRHKIEIQKRAINDKKYKLRQDLELLKRKFITPTSMSVTLLGGLLIGYALIPKKYKVSKLLIKALTVGTTLKQIMDFVPSQPKKIHRQRIH